MRSLLPLCILVFAAASGPTTAATFGKCKFDKQSFAFAGTPAEQASCLLRKVKILGNVDATPAQLPANLAGFIGKPVTVSKAKLRQAITAAGLTEAGVGGSLDDPLSRGNTNNPNAPQARYFVIHDTSTPNLVNEPFPADIDTSNRVNRLDRYHDATDAKAHIFLNRKGETYVGHKLNVPWRATKLEGTIGTLSRGMFIHIENIQPRRKHPSQPDGNAPTPGFSATQYDRLALLYLVASTRAGTGLVPAFHAAMDEGISNGHDDPQNFSLADFDAAFGRVLADMN